MKLVLFLCIGLILSPTLLALKQPSFAPMLFTWAACGFLFVAGLELSFKKVRAQLKPALILSTGAFILPFVVGLLAAPLILPGASSRTILFLAIALSVSALPVIIQFLREAKVYGTPVGRLIVATATLCDMAAWVAFAFLLEEQAQQGWIESHLPVFCFFAGLIIADLPFVSEKFKTFSFKFSTWTFSPIFFIGIGWKINLHESFNLTQVLVITVLASLSKFIGAYLAAAPLKINVKERVLVSLSLNARGAMEILIASTALKQGLIDETLFTSLVIMALATSLVLGPLTSTAAARSRN
jgi:Kef-type K+ transport system membrane component KefB